METVRLTIGGMSCGHCQQAVQQALRRHPGVRTATVDLQNAAAEVEYDATTVSPGELTAAVEGEGYTAAVARPHPGA